MNLYSLLITREGGLLEVICRVLVVTDWGILVQSNHHQRDEGDAGDDLQGVAGD
jgi:hypothetical protein